jgi:hypothetical protein
MQHVMIVASWNECFSPSIYPSFERQKEGSMRRRKKKEGRNKTIFSIEGIDVMCRYSSTPTHYLSLVT